MKNEFPPVDEELIKRLDELYPITDADLKAPEWERAFLAGQRDVVNRLRTEWKQQEKRMQQNTVRRRA